MKVLFFAHTPPPHHGQSYMVQLLLEGLAASGSIDCVHVNARLSDDLQDVGGFRFGKIARLLGFCAQAVRLRLRTGASTLYYVPAPPHRTPLFRDWLALALLRPCFSRIVFHWHAAGLGEWLEQQPAWLRVISRLALGHADLSISLAHWSAGDANKLSPRSSRIVPYGIPDPCADFEPRLRTVREQRTATLRSELTSPAADNGERIVVLFVALCTREKGLFDALEGVAKVNRKLAAEGCGLRLELHVAGAFAEAAERDEVERIVAASEWRGLYRYHGFVSGRDKSALFERADMFLFPTRYSAESFPVVLLEAMAFGLPIVSTRWRAIPEMLPAQHAGLVSPGDTDSIARALRQLAHTDDGLRLRAHFVEHFTLQRYIDAMTAALRRVEDDAA